MKITFPQRVKVAMDIIKGKREGRFGQATVCDEFKRDDNSPAVHQDSWRLDLTNGLANCDGTVKIIK